MDVAHPTSRTKAFSSSNTLTILSWRSQTQRLGSSFEHPLPVTRSTKHNNPLIFPTQVPKLLRTGATGSPAGPGWPGAPSLTLSRQLTFSVGYTTFPQRAHWGFIVAVPAGGGCCCGGDWGLRGAAVTSPGEPRATSGQAEGLRALANCPGEVQGGAAGPGAGRTQRRWHWAPGSGCAPLALRR